MIKFGEAGGAMLQLFMRVVAFVLFAAAGLAAPARAYTIPPVTGDVRALRAMGYFDGHQFLVGAPTRVKFGFVGFQAQAANNLLRPSLIDGYPIVDDLQVLLPFTAELPAIPDIFRSGLNEPRASTILGASGRGKPGVITFDNSGDLNSGSPENTPPAAALGGDPEAATWAMMVFGFFSVGLLAYRRSHRLRLT
jgi:hypothetical protein